MGILSRMGFMQQGAFLPQQPEVFSPYFRAQPQQPAPAPQPRPSPAMTGFQSPANLPTAQPMQTNQSPLAQLNTAPAPSPQFSFMDRLAMGANQLPNNALFNMGLSLLGNAQGSRWDRVASDMQSFGQQQQQRQILQNEQRRQAAQDRREETIFGRQQRQWGLQDQQRADWEAALRGEQDPARQAQLRAMGPEGYGQFLLTQEQQRFQAEQAALDRANARNVAGIRLTGANRPEGAAPGWQRPSNRDQMLLQDYEGAVQNARVALRGLDRLESLFGELIQRDAQGNPIPASMRMPISRLMQINPEARAAYEQIQAQVWPLVLQALEGLAPVTEVELGQALGRTINADMTPEAVMAEIARLREEAQYAQSLGLAAFDFAGEGGSLATGRNAAGQSWLDYSGAFNRPEAPARGDGGGGASGGASSGGWPTPPPAAIQRLQSNPTQRERSYYDAIFGPGAAARDLGGAPVRQERTGVFRDSNNRPFR